VKSFLSPLPVEKLWGVGRKTKVKLNELGIKTIGELARYPVNKLIEEFGKLGYEYHLSANGIDESEVEETYEIKSLGREHTFDEDTDDIGKINDTLNSLIEEVVKEIEEGNYFFRTVTVKVRYEDFETHTHSQTLAIHTNELKILQKTAEKLLKRFISGKKIRLIGIRVSNLVKIKESLLKTISSSNS
jgi:DNA polymerase IV (DinB-like DNA polymerase)